MKYASFVFALCAGIALQATTVFAQGQAAPASPNAFPAPLPAQPPAAAQPAAAGQPAAPAADVNAVNRENTELVVTLLRTTMVAVHQANFSGNYSLLRDIAAPDFQAKNSAADLARIFTNLRELKVDLSASVLLNPQISKAELTADKKLYIVGALATKPVPVTFEMLFQPVAGIWRVYGISITPVQALASSPPSALSPSKPVVHHAGVKKKPARPAPMPMGLPPPATAAPPPASRQ